MLTNRQTSIIVHINSRSIEIEVAAKRSNAEHGRHRGENET